MNREEDGGDEVVCLDESFFINDEWVRVRDKFLSSPFLFIFINSLMILLIHTLSLSTVISSPLSLLAPKFFTSSASNLLQVSVFFFCFLMYKYFPFYRKWKYAVKKSYYVGCGTADFDLTGQLVWPGAMLMNDYLSKNPDVLQASSILELGSGVGISQFSSNVYIMFFFPTYSSSIRLFHMCKYTHFVRWHPHTLKYRLRL